MGLEDRVTELERALVDERRGRLRGRRLLALLACATVLIAAGEPLKTLRASRVEIGPRDVPRIVLGEGKTGPLVELRDEEGFVATLTARGLSLAAPEPTVRPTLTEPGLAEVVDEDPDLATVARIVVEDYASAVEVACPGLMYRERTAVVGGTALVEVPDDPRCTAHVKGGKIIGRFPVKAGWTYRCSADQRPACQVAYDWDIEPDGSPAEEAP